MFGICVLIVLKVNVASIFAISNNLQQLTDGEQVLLNEVVVKRILVKPAKIAHNE